MATPAQNEDFLFSPKGIAEIHITLEDGKQIGDIENEKQQEHAGKPYIGKLRAKMTVKNSATSIYTEDQFYTGNILIDGRGNTSWNRSKRPYNIDFVEDDWTTNRRAPLLDIPEGEEFTLLNFWVDRSLMRIPLAFYLGQKMPGILWTPHGQYVEVWINDDYRGLYFVSEKIQRDNNRIDIKKNNAESNDLSGGYILEVTPRDGDKSKAIETQTQIQSGPYNINFVFKYPKPKNLTDEYGQSQRAWIKNWLDEYENVLRGDNFKDPVNGYQKYINEESFIDWTVLHELSKGCDNLFHASCFMHKDRNGKLNMSAPWDFDLSFGNSGVYMEENNWVKTHAWFGRLNQDDRYAQKFIDRYEALLPLFNQIPQILEANYKQLDEAGVLTREYAKYPDIIDGFVSDGEGRRTPTTYKGHVQWLSEWTMSRNNWVYVNLGRTDADKGLRMKEIKPVIRVMDPEAVNESRSFEVKVMRSDENGNNNKYTYSWNDGSFENRPSFRITAKGKYWVKIKDQWGNVSLASDTLRFGTNDEGPVIYWVATASSSNPGEEPYNAVDDLTATHWSSGKGQSGDEWFAVDMQDRQKFNTIVLQQENGETTYPRLCQVYISNNGVDWGEPVVTEAGQQENVMRIRLPQVYETRYVKLMQTGTSGGGSAWVIHEFKVENVNYQNLWFPYASSASTGANPKNAFDGDISTRWSTGAAQVGDEWFAFDMLDMQSFNTIILKQTGSENDYPRGYAVYTAQNAGYWSKVVVTGEGTYGEETRIVLPKSRNAQYIKIEQTGKADDNWWSIHEISIEENTAISEVGQSPVEVAYRNGQLQVFNASPEARLTVYSISGQRVNSTSLAPGVYVVVIADAEQVYTEKLIVQ
ncbi:hypothetical protein AGMMS50262_04770 [Bacteroidia bacterium]|nr:hypothetical protein AGMMS50262_04770 [Bacteroidia bacterium]